LSKFFLPQFFGCPKKPKSALPNGEKKRGEKWAQKKKVPSKQKKKGGLKKKVCRLGASYQA